MTLLRNYYLLSLLIIFQPALAISWQDLWLRPDQQAARHLAAGNAKQAAKQFENPEWQAVANYRMGNYAQAALGFKQVPHADAYYNYANSLALQGKYQKALEAYSNALAANPNLQDAIDNRELVKKLLRQQEQQSQTEQQSKQDQTASANKNSKAERSQATQSSSKTQQNSAQAQSSQPKPQNSSQSQATKQLVAPHPNQTQAAQAARSQQQRSGQSQSIKQPASSHQSSAPSKQPAQPSQQKSGQPQPREQTLSKPSLSRQEPESLQQQLANEQWLNQIPDEPSELLRQKFLRDHERLQNLENF